VIAQACIDSYGKLKNLKLVGSEIGIPWQTVYVHLRKAGVPVTGDKARYGSAKDRLASFAERLFAEDVPTAIDSNASQFQASIDFLVLGWSVDVKASARQLFKNDAIRWAFCINKQKDKADFFVLYALNNSDERHVEHVFLLPNEIATARTTISVPETMNSKWADYEIRRDELDGFFSSLHTKDAQP
jgi:hypothetical protein